MDRGHGLSVWQPLADSLEPEVRQLTVRLRELKDDSGLSLAALAHKTPASRSSWSRYLNGQQLPPRSVVAALGDLTDADLDQLMALWEAAEHAHSRRTAITVDDTSGINTAPTSRTGADGATDAVPADQPSGEHTAGHDVSAGNSLSRERAAKPVLPVPRRLMVVVACVLSALALTVVVSGLYEGHFRPADKPSRSPATSPAPQTPAPDSSGEAGESEEVGVKMATTRPPDPNTGSQGGPSVEKGPGTAGDPEGDGELSAAGEGGFCSEGDVDAGSEGPCPTDPTLP
ncbi:hypothetical protein GCM10010411_73980 [Actinomadura fulvescens]|uniref:HTH cro/C1-type domain-containing protein n=1 Tax=Actinomadura fulvescens TaxID=46160 RepID=A0ABP6CUL7_9ACTN